MNIGRIPYALAASVGMAASLASHAAIIEGTLYYTHHSGGGANVLSVSFKYDDGPHTVVYGAQTGLATVAGADGIMFAPNGNLLVTSNSLNNVYRVDASTGATLQTVSTGTTGSPDFHMALDPSGTQFYSSNRYTRTDGPLDTFGINADGSITSATTSPIIGGDTNITQLAFGGGKVLYVNGTPNCCGSVGLFTFGASNTTDRLFASIAAAHGIVYDPYTGLMTMFGGGQVATVDPSKATNAEIIASLKERDVPDVFDFDQGSVDGLGHAFIAGDNMLTFIDYSVTHDITSPDNIVILTSGFDFIDDISPLVGLGAPPTGQVPEPGILALLGIGLLGLVRGRLKFGAA